MKKDESFDVEKDLRLAKANIAQLRKDALAAGMPLGIVENLVKAAQEAYAEMEKNWKKTQEAKDDK
jgi:hypothetical protein